MAVINFEPEQTAPTGPSATPIAFEPEQPRVPKAELLAQQAAARRSGGLARALLGAANFGEQFTKATADMPTTLVNIPSKLVGNPDLAQPGVPLVNFPTANPQQVADAMDVLKGRAAEPSRPPTQAEQVASGLQQAVAGTASGFTTPEMITALPAGAARPLMTAFGAQMAKDLPEAVGQGATAAGDIEMPLDQRVLAGANPVIQAAMITSLARHTNAGTPTPVEPLRKPTTPPAAPEAPVVDPNAPVPVRTPDGAIDHVQTALEQMRAQAKAPVDFQPEAKPPEAAAAEHPLAPAVADLSAKVDELKAALTKNQIAPEVKPSEPKPASPAKVEQPSPPAAATAPAAPAASETLLQIQARQKAGYQKSVDILEKLRPGLNVEMGGTGIEISPDGKTLRVNPDLFDDVSKLYPGREEEIFAKMLHEEETHKANFESLGDNFTSRLSDIWQRAPAQIKALVRKIYGSEPGMKDHHWGAELVRMASQAVNGDITETVHADRGADATAGISALADWARGQTGDVADAIKAGSDVVGPTKEKPVTPKVNEIGAAGENRPIGEKPTLPESKAKPVDFTPENPALMEKKGVNETPKVPDNTVPAGGEMPNQRSVWDTSEVKPVETAKPAAQGGQKPGASDLPTPALNTYDAFYNGKKIEVEAESSYKAQQIAVEKFKAKPKQSHMVSIVHTGKVEPIETRAQKFMQERFKDVRRRGGDLASEHIERVAARVTDPILKTVAYLHDMVEDTPTTIAEIRQKFGDRIADAVDAETHRKATGETYEQYIERLSSNPDAVTSKIADIADNLESAKSWPDSELVRGKIAQWTKARARLEKTIKPTIDRATMPDGKTPREDWRKKQIRKTLDLVKPKSAGESVTITFMGGGPAAGKTTVKNLAIKQGKISSGEAVVIAADDFKTGEGDVERAGAEGIPEFKTLSEAGVQTAAVIVHKESTTMAKQALARAVMENRHAVYDATMSDHGKDGALIKAAHEAGHETEMMGVYLSPDEAWARAQKREAKTGRHVPEDVVKNGHIEFARSFPGYVKMVDDGILDKIVIYDNHTRDPKVIYEKDKNGVVIHDQKAYDSFVGNGKNELVKSKENPTAGSEKQPADVAPDAGRNGRGESGRGPQDRGAERGQTAGENDLAGVKPHDAETTISADGDDSLGGKQPVAAGEPGGQRAASAVSDVEDGSVLPASGAGDGGQTGERGTDGAGRTVSDVDGLPGSKDKTPVDFNAGVESGDGAGSIRGGSQRGQLPGGKQRSNLRLTESLAPTGDTARIKANIAAIKLIRTLEKEKRTPTDDEVKQIAQWSGWGSFKNIFNEGKAERREWDQGWQKKYGKAYDQLRELLSEEEFNAAAESSVTAHYTSKEIVDWAWAAAERLGFKGGKALEPGAGSGVFIGHIPESVADKTQWTAVEMEPMTGAILSHIYPEADTRIQGFEETKLPNGYFDLSISNVPFHEVGPGKEYPDLNLHNYFIARMLDKVKPGGLVVTVSSKGTMDANPRQRALLASKGQLVAAIRLPNNAFKESANTQVVTDLLILRRPDGKPFEGQRWQNMVNVAKEGEPPIMVNEYYAEHPEMVLGKHALTGSMYGKNEYTVEGTGPLTPKLAAALEALPKDIIAEPVSDYVAPATKRDDYSVFINADGKVVESRGFQEHLPAWDSSSPELVKTAKAYIAARDTLKDQYRLERTEGVTDAEIEANRKTLAKQYATLKKQLVSKQNPKGYISEGLRKMKHLETDPDYYTLLGLENTKNEKDPKDPSRTRQRIVESDILSKRVGKVDAPPAKAGNASEALGISQAYRGGMDMDYLQKLTGMEPEQIAKELTDADLAYLDVDTGKLVTRDEYLGGDIRDKYAKAIFAAKDDPRFERNVEALKKVIPENQPFGKIKFGVEARWIPTEIHNAFAREVMGLEGDPVRFVPTTEEFAVTAPRKVRSHDGLSEKARVDYSTPERGALSLLDSALNMKRVKVTYTDKDGKTFEDVAASTNANQIVDKIKDEFEKWARTTDSRVPHRIFDTERGEYRQETLPVWDAMEREFNRKKNSFVKPDYDGTKLKLPGVTDWFWRKQHILDGVQRGIQQGSTVYAYGVGSGKTSLAVILDHELRRIGLAKKSVLVVKKPTVGQYRSTIEALYPGSKVLIPSADDFKKANRRLLVSRMAAGNFDHIVLTHEQLKSIPPSEKSIKAFFNEQIDALRQVLQEMGAADAENEKSTRGMDRQVANIVKKLKSLKKRLDERLTSIAKHQDAGLSWEDLGIDALHIDESHNFKNIPITTQLDNVKGVPSSFSQRAVDLVVKARDVQKRTNGRNVFYYTGTPVSNTLAELWGQIHVTNPKLLEDMGVKTFDSFATAFADVTSNFEFGWDNKFKEVTRMAKFKNGAALTSLTRMGLSVKIGNEELGLDVPKMRGGGPQVLTVPMNPEFQRWNDIVEDISGTWQGLDPKGRFENSWVPIATMRAGSAAALDPRLVFPDAQDHPNSKVNQAIKKVFESWEAGKDKRTTQMVMADLYRGMNTDKLMGFLGGHTHEIEAAPGKIEIDDLEGAKAKPEDENAEDAADTGAKDEAAYEKNAVGKFNLYHDIRDKLIKMGVPAHEIGIITEHETDAKRDALFDKVRAGAVRVLIGSTEKIGEGVDVPQRLAMLTRLDPPMQMTAAKLDQCIGRIIRQGNLHSPKNWNIPVDVLLYAQERSMDAPIYNMMQTKGKMTLQALKGQFLGDEFEDPASEMTVAMAQLVAQATGDTRALEAAKLTEDVRKLTMEENAHYRKISDLKRTVDDNQQASKRAVKESADMTELAAAAKEATADKDNITMSGKSKTYTGADAINERMAVLSDAFDKALVKDGDKQEVPMRFGKNFYAVISAWARNSNEWAIDDNGLVKRNADGSAQNIVKLVKRYAVDFTTADKMPEYDQNGFHGGKITISSELTSPNNLLQAVRNVAGRAEDRANQAKATIEKADKEAAAYANKLKNTSFDKEAELNAKRAELDKLQSALMGGATTRSGAAAMRAAKRKGLLIDQPEEKLPPSAERDQLRRQMDQTEQAGLDADQQAEIDQNMETIKRGERYLADPDPEMGDHHLDRQRSNIKNAQDRIKAIRAEAAKSAGESNAPKMKRLGEIEKTMLDWLDKAIKATDYDPNSVLEGVTGAPVWISKAAAHGALKLIKFALKGGMALADAIREGLWHLKQEHPSDFNEGEARKWIESTLAGDDIRPERERSAADLKEERDNAETEVREATRRKENQTQKEYKQTASLAGARYRTVQDELATHPDFVREQILKQHEAISEANDILKPLGMAMTPEDFPNIGAVAEKLGADKAKRVNELGDVVSKASAELARTNRLAPKLAGRITNELMNDGRLPSIPDITANAGRTLDKVTDWLRDHQVNSPRRSIMERMNLVGRMTDELHRGKDAVTKAWQSAVGAGRALKEIYIHPPVDTNFREVIKTWLYADQRTGLATHQFVKAITAKVSTPVRRQAIALWLDAGGDEGLLRMQSQTVPDRFRKPFELALKLTGDEKALANQIRQDFEAKRDDAIATGLMEKGREDGYVPQRWEIAPEPDFSKPRAEKQGSAGRANAKLDPRDPFFSFEREYPTYFDGIMAGGVPENLDIAHLVATYDGAFHKALSSRGAIAALQMAQAADGRPVTKISGSASIAPAAAGARATFVDSRAFNKSDVAEDGRPYKILDHFALKGWKIVSKDGAGNPIIVKGDMMIHPDHFDYLKNELGTSAFREGIPGIVFNPVLKSQAFLKASKLSASFFHVFTIGEHMLSHMANPFLNGFKIDLRDPDQSLLVRNGLELGMGAQRMAFEEGLASGNAGLFAKIPGIGDVSVKMTDAIFKDYIPAIMMKTGLKALAANRKRYGHKLTDSQIAEETAQQMNAAGGFPNYRLRGADGNFWGKLGGNKTLMDFNRLLLLAPSFLEARARVVAQALKPYGQEQRKMLITQAALLYVGCRVLNQWLDDDAHWTDEPFSVVYKGRAYSMRTIVGDFWHLLTDPKSFAAGRLSPVSKMAIETLTQRDLRTGARKEPMIQTDWMPGRVAQIAIEDMARWMMPIWAEGMLPGATGREQTPADMALSSFGVGSHKATASGEMYKLAAEFNRESPDPKAQRNQLARDAAPQRTSDYRKLDALLEAGDQQGAQREYAELIKSGHDADTIKRRYNRYAPFTGNAEREKLFVASLDDEQKKMHARALVEHDARVRAFNQLRR